MFEKLFGNDIQGLEKKIRFKDQEIEFFKKRIEQIENEKANLEYRLERAKRQ